MAAAADKSPDEPVRSAPRRDAHDLRAPQHRRADRQHRAGAIPPYGRVVQPVPDESGRPLARYFHRPGVPLDREGDHSSATWLGTFLAWLRHWSCPFARRREIRVAALLSRMTGCLEEGYRGGR